MEEYKCSTKKTNSQAKGKKNRKIITTETVKASVQGLFEVSYSVDIVSKWDKSNNMYVEQLPFFNYSQISHCDIGFESFVLGSFILCRYVRFEYFMLVLKGDLDYSYNRKRDRVVSIPIEPMKSFKSGANRRIGFYELLENNSVEGYRWYLLTTTNHPTYGYNRYMDDLRVRLYGKKGSSIRYFSVFESDSKFGYKPHYHFAVLLEEGLDVSRFLSDNADLNLYYKEPKCGGAMRIASYLTKSGNPIKWNNRSKHLLLNTTTYLDMGGIGNYIDMLNNPDEGWQFHKTVNFKERVNTETGEVYSDRMIVFRRKTKQTISKQFKANSLLLKVRKKYYTKVVSIAYDTLDE